MSNKWSVFLIYSFCIFPFDIFQIFILAHRKNSKNAILFLSFCFSFSSHTLYFFTFFWVMLCSFLNQWYIAFTLFTNNSNHTLEVNKTERSYIKEKKKKRKKEILGQKLQKETRKIHNIMAQLINTRRYDKYKCMWLHHSLWCTC